MKVQLSIIHWSSPFRKSKTQHKELLMYCSISLFLFFQSNFRRVAPDHRKSIFFFFSKTRPDNISLCSVLFSALYNVIAQKFPPAPQDSLSECESTATFSLIIPLCLFSAQIMQIGAWQSDRFQSNFAAGWLFKGRQRMSQAAWACVQDDIWICIYLYTSSHLSERFFKETGRDANLARSSKWYRCDLFLLSSLAFQYKNVQLSQIRFGEKTTTK